MPEEIQPQGFSADAAIGLGNALLGLLAVLNPAAAGVALPVMEAINAFNTFLVPQIKHLFESGEITIEQQKELYDAMEVIRARVGLPPAPDLPDDSTPTTPTP